MINRIPYLHGNFYCSLSHRLIPMLMAILVNAGPIVNYVTGGGFDRGVCFSTLVTLGGGKFYATLKMQGQGVKFYLKNVKRGNVFILGYCKGVKIYFPIFLGNHCPPVT